jgi:VWFA-related protein
MKQRSVPPVFLLAFLLAAPATAISQPAPAMAAFGKQPAAGADAVVPGNRSASITLDVVVTDRSGAPVSGLQAADFNLLDNKRPQSILSLQPANGITAQADPPVELILLVDALNPAFQTVARERQSLAAYFKENGQKLALPTTLVVLTDKGMKIQEQPTRNGNALLDYLNANATGLRAIRRSQGLEGEMEREHHSLVGLDFLASQMSKRPGRKLLIWLSPGWSIYSDLVGNWRARAHQAVFANIAALSTAMRQARITLYSIDPEGVGEGKLRYLDYLKGVDAPEHADYGHLFLQVLATQSGGQVLYGNNDLAGLIDRCVADAKSYYVLTFNAPPAAHANEYHGLEVAIDKPGLTARTRTGFYAQP